MYCIVLFIVLLFVLLFYCSIIIKNYYKLIYITINFILQPSYIPEKIYFSIEV